MENIVLFKDPNHNSENSGIAGGWVKDPVTGMNRWCVTYDFASLYPSIQRQFYIAPENFIGVQSKSDSNLCDNNALIDKENHVVCSNGVVFNKKKSPTIRMLEDVYFDRKSKKKIMMSKKEELNSVLEEIKKLESELN